MKFFLSWMLLLSSTIIFTQQLSGKVTYVVSIIPISDKMIDSISKKSEFKNVKVNKTIRDLLKNAPNVNAYLEFINGESIYYAEQKMK
ncbi:hypothetical protein [Polaribacter sp.]|uniref:hypothetical protein n=1 Tax=Polaribacter sp. TaxID=1920175 RepID=UPI003F6CB80B